MLTILVMNKPELLNILEKIRKKMKSHAILTSYSSPESLERFCGVCSYIVFRTLKDKGYKPTFHMGDNHCYVTTNGYWVDLTLKQFNKKCPSIYLKKRPYARDDGYGNVHKADNSAKTEAKIKRMFTGWGKEQNPFRQRLPKITV
jgi:hypothetical protein